MFASRLGEVEEQIVEVQDGREFSQAEGLTTANAPYTKDSLQTVSEPFFFLVYKGPVTLMVQKLSAVRSIRMYQANTLETCMSCVRGQFCRHVCQRTTLSTSYRLGSCTYTLYTVHGPGAVQVMNTSLLALRAAVPEIGVKRLLNCKPSIRGPICSSEQRGFAHTEHIARRRPRESVTQAVDLPQQLVFPLFSAEL